MSELVWTTGGLYPSLDTCKHGRLKRQCNECDLQEKNEQLQATNKQLLDALVMTEGTLTKGLFNCTDSELRRAQEARKQAIANAKQVMGDSDE